MKLKIGKKYWICLKRDKLVKIGCGSLYDVYTKFKDKPLLAKTYKGKLGHTFMCYIDERLKNFYVYKNSGWQPDRFHIVEIKDFQLELNFG